MRETENECTSYFKRQELLKSGLRVALGVMVLNGCVSDEEPIDVAPIPAVTAPATLAETTTTHPEATSTTATTNQTTTTSTSTSTTTTSTTTTLAPETTTTTIDLRENYTPYEYSVGERIGRIYTSDGLVNTDLYLTDTFDEARQVREPVEDPELDYIDQGAGLSYDSGFPGMPGNSVILAHNTSEGKDFFRNLGNVKAGTILTLEYEKNGFQDVLIFEATSDPFFVGNDFQAGDEIYGSKPYESSLTTYTCNTVNDKSSERTVVVWRLVAISEINQLDK